MTETIFLRIFQRAVSCADDFQRFHTFKRLILMLEKKSNLVIHKQ